MLNFIRVDEVETVLEQQESRCVCIPVAVDTVTTCSAFTTLCQRYPDLAEKYHAFIKGREMRPGFAITITVDDGVVVGLIFIKTVDAYQANILDIQQALATIISRLKQFNVRTMVLHNITTENTKLSDQILIPMIAHEILTSPGITVHFVCPGNTKIIEDINDDGINIIKNSWASAWNLNDEDIIMTAILNELGILSSGVKLSKSKLLILYKIAHDNGMFQQYTFVNGEYGWYFKQFMTKLSAQLNHGLLVDTERFSTSKRTDYHIGPMFPLLVHIASSFLFGKREQIRKIAMVMRVKLAEIKKEAYEQRQKNDGNTNTWRF